MVPVYDDVYFSYYPLCHIIYEFKVRYLTQRSNASAKLYIGTKLSLTLLLAITAIGYAPLVQAADITIEKAAPRSNLQVAIVPFAGAESISSIISNDLTNLGQFSLDNNLPERPHSSGEVTLPVWQHKAVPYLVVGNTRTNRGDVEINFEVINVGTGEVIQGAQQVKTKNNPQVLRLAGHKVADKIYEILTGIKGDFFWQNCLCDRVGYAKKSCVAFGRIGCGRL